jgi:trehalose/maltose transport system substrate-binding protein
MSLPPGGPGGKRTGALGGWNLGVSRYSKHQAEAISLVKYLTGPQEQKRRAIAYAANPTIASLYEDPDVLKANPFMGKLSETFANAVARPSKATARRYNRVSAELQTAVHAALAGTAPADEMMKRLAEKLRKMSNGGRW